jgi:hypothetical protein
MKKIAISLIALAALSGAAFANSNRSSVADWNSSSGLVESVSNGFGLEVRSRQQCR